MFSVISAIDSTSAETFPRADHQPYTLSCYVGCHPKNDSGRPWDDIKQHCLLTLTHWGHIPDNIFKCIFVNENFKILIKISLKFVVKDPIKNIPAMVQIMAWHLTGGKPLSEQMMAWFGDAYMLLLASMS